jgi:SWI/SNF chromatin-remodeling complex subunit SWI1
MNMSRSQTPQQVGAFPSPFPYQQHLQAGGSTNATPSPTMQNQQFRPPSQAQRMNTMSPNPQFAQQQQQPMGISPPPEANGRMTPQTPQFHMGNQMSMGMPNQMVSQMQNQMGQQMNPQMAAAFPGGQMPQGFNPNFAGMQGMNQQAGFAAQVSLPPNMAAQQAQVQRDYQIKMQQAAQQQQVANMQRQGMQQAAAMRGIMGAQQPSMGTPTRPPQQQNPQLQAQTTAFLKRLQAFAIQAGLHFDPQPMIFGRPVNLFALFQYVIKAKGSKTVTNMNYWPKVAAALGFAEPNAGNEIKEIFEKCMGQYEASYWNNINARKGQTAAPGMQPGMPGGQMSPTRSTPQTPQSANAQHPQMMSNRPPSTSIPPEQMTPVQTNASIAMSNGWTTPQMETPSMKAQSLPSAQQKSTSRPPDASPVPAKQSPNSKEQDTMLINGRPKSPYYDTWLDEKCWLFGKAAQDKAFGGIALEALFKIGREIAQVKPTVPDPVDMGLIDVRAVSLSLQSGIRSEVRYALDVLLKMTGSAQISLDLDACEDLLDILIDCAEDQVDILQREAPEVSDFIDLTSYEDLVRNAQLEFLTVQELPEAGTSAHDADRAAEKLLAITTILRNLSFPIVHNVEKNNSWFIARNSTVIKFISNTIRLVGTRHLLLRTHLRTQDFMKDIVVLLSNASDHIHLPSREDGISLLHFLLAFAPSPNPVTLTELRFSLYQPRIHRYYPPAVDSLVKLMLVDDSNRLFFKSIFSDPSLSPAAHPSSSSPSAPVITPAIHQTYALLTRAFGLAIAVLPDRTGMQLSDERLGFLREATLSQGLLAADVLTGLLPTGLDAGPPLARAWLGSNDSWIPSLVNLCRAVFNNPEIRILDQWRSIVNRGLGMLRRLGALGVGKVGNNRSNKAHKSVAEAHLLSNGEPSASDAPDAIAEEKDAVVPVVESENVAWEHVHADALPNWSFVMGALNMNNMDASILRNLVALAGLEE